MHPIAGQFIGIIRDLKDLYNRSDLQGLYEDLASAGPLPYRQLGQLTRQIQADPVLSGTRYADQAREAWQSLKGLIQVDQMVTLSRDASRYSETFTDDAEEVVPEEVVFPVRPAAYSSDFSGIEKGDYPVGLIGPGAAADEELFYELFGIRLRDYQRAYVVNALQAIDDGKDRALIRDPWQVGKTLMIGPFIEAARDHFPGKKALVILPYKIIKRQVLEDLAKYFPKKKIGIIDANRKDFTGDYDIVVASIHTLERPENLARLNRDEYGLVVNDEATFSRTRRALPIYQHLGFLDSQRRIRKNPGKFLLGLTADSVSLSMLFGTDKPIATHGLTWFINKQYLHKVEGISVSYADYIEMEEHPLEAGERVVSPRAEDAYNQAILRAYEDRLKGKKILVNVSSINQAIELEKAFNAEYGVNFARAVHADRERLSDANCRKIVNSYNDGTGPKILIYVDILSHGYRAKGTEGILNAFQSNSLRRYGQRIGRALGKETDEPQRTIRVVDMVGKGHALNSPASLPRLFGQSSYEEEGKVFDPSKPPAKGGKSTSKTVTAVRNTKGILNFKYVDEGERVIRPELFPSFIRKALFDSFGGDPLLMAQTMSIDLDVLDRYLYGELPRSLAEVRMIAKTLRIPAEELVRAWEEDAIRIIDALYPVSPDFGPAVQSMIRLVRRAVLIKGSGSVRSALDDAQRSDYKILQDVFRGKQFSLGERAGKFIYRVVATSQILPDAGLKKSFHEAIQEECQRRGIKEARLMVYDDGDGDDVIFDPMNDIDAYEREVIPMGVDPSERFGNAEWESYRTHLADQLITPSPEDASMYGGLQESVKRVLATLAPREEAIIRLRFGLNDGEERTFDAVGVDFEITSSRAQGIIVKALRKLQHPSRSKRLRPYIQGGQDLFYSAHLSHAATLRAEAAYSYSKQACLVDFFTKDYRAVLAGLSLLADPGIDPARINAFRSLPDSEALEGLARLDAAFLLREARSDPLSLLCVLHLAFLNNITAKQIILSLREGELRSLIKAEGILLVYECMKLGNPDAESVLKTASEREVSYIHLPYGYKLNFQWTVWKALVEIGNAAALKTLVWKSANLEQQSDQSALKALNQVKDHPVAKRLMADFSVDEFVEPMRKGNRAMALGIFALVLLAECDNPGARKALAAIPIKRLRVLADSEHPRKEDKYWMGRAREAFQILTEWQAQKKGVKTGKKISQPSIPTEGDALEAGIVSTVPGNHIYVEAPPIVRSKKGEKAFGDLMLGRSIDQKRFPHAGAGSTHFARRGVWDTWTDSGASNGALALQRRNSQALKAPTRLRRATKWRTAIRSISARRSQVSLRRTQRSSVRINRNLRRGLHLRSI